MSAPGRGAPRAVAAQATPMPENPPMVGGAQPHLDIEATLSQLWQMAHKAETRPPADSGAFDAERVEVYEKKIARAQRWGGWVWGVLAIVGVVFSGGVAYAVFLGANATDAEVEKAVHSELAEHNGGTHPDTIDPVTHQPVGDHPDIRQEVSAVKTEVQGLKVQTTRMETTQKKLDKRSEYQFQLTRYESQVAEAKRRRERPPKKPPTLDKLETDLMMGKYD